MVTSQIWQQLWRSCIVAFGRGHCHSKSEPHILPTWRRQNIFGFEFPWPSWPTYRKIPVWVFVALPCTQCGDRLFDFIKGGAPRTWVRSFAEELLQVAWCKDIILRKTCCCKDTLTVPLQEWPLCKKYRQIKNNNKKHIIVSRKWMGVVDFWFQLVSTEVHLTVRTADPRWAQPFAAGSWSCPAVVAVGTIGDALRLRVSEYYGSVSMGTPPQDHQPSCASSQPKNKQRSGTLVILSIIFLVVRDVYCMYKCYCISLNHLPFIFVPSLDAHMKKTCICSVLIARNSVLSSTRAPEILRAGHGFGCFFGFHMASPPWNKRFLFNLCLISCTLARFFQLSSVQMRPGFGRCFSGRPSGMKPGFLSYSSLLYIYIFNRF